MSSPITSRTSPYRVRPTILILVSHQVLPGYSYTMTFPRTGLRKHQLIYVYFFTYLGAPNHQLADIRDTYPVWLF